MKQRTEPWYRNPFQLGGVGMIALLGSLALTREEAPVRALTFAARLLYIAGLGTVLTAAVLWFIQAQAPETPITEDVSEEESPDARDDDEAFDDE